MKHLKKYLSLLLAVAMLMTCCTAVSEEVLPTVEEAAPAVEETAEIIGDIPAEASEEEAAPAAEESAEIIGDIPAEEPEEAAEEEAPEENTDGNPEEAPVEAPEEESVEKNAEDFSDVAAEKSGEEYEEASEYALNQMENELFAEELYGASENAEEDVGELYASGFPYADIVPKYKGVAGLIYIETYTGDNEIDLNQLKLYGVTPSGGEVDISSYFSLDVTEERILIDGSSQARTSAYMVSATCTNNEWFENPNFDTVFVLTLMVPKPDVTLSSNSAEWKNGNDLTPSLTVKYGTNVVDSYTATWKKDGAVVTEIKDIGTYTVEVTYTPDGIVTTTGTATFTVNPIDLSNYEIVLQRTEAEYNKSIQPHRLDAIKVNNEEVTGWDDAGMRITAYRNYGTDKQTLVDQPNQCIDAGVITVVLTNPNDKIHYTGKATAEYTIKPIDISTNDTFTLLNTSFEYTGAEMKSAATITSPISATLSASKDLIFTADDLVNAGTPTVTVTGQGNYTGTRTVQFTISPCPVFTEQSKVKVTEPESATYDEQPHKNAPILKSQYNAKGQLALMPDERYTLVEGKDYSLEYYRGEAMTDDFTSIGTITVKVTCKDNFSGSNSYDYSITKSLSHADIYVDCPSVTYNGQVQTPVITVKDGDNVLTEHTDYEVSYGSADMKNAGDYTVTVTGTGCYKDSAEKTFTIKPIALDELTINLKSDSAAYDGKSHKPEVESITSGGEDCTDAFIEVVRYYRNYGTAKQTELKSNSDFVKAGKITLAIEAEGDTNFTGKSTTVFTITKDEADEEDEEETETASVASAGVNPVVNSKALWGFVDDDTVTVSIAIRHADGTEETVSSDKIILTPEGFFFADTEPMQEGDTITVSLTDDEGNVVSGTIEVADSLPPIIATALGANISGEIDGEFKHAFAMPIDLSELAEGESFTVPILIYDSIEIGAMTFTLNGDKLDVTCELLPGAEAFLPEGAKFHFSSYDEMPTIDALLNGAHTDTDAQAQGTLSSIDISESSGVIWLYAGVDCEMDAQSFVNALSGAFNFYIWADMSDEPDVSDAQLKAYEQYESFCAKAN